MVHELNRKPRVVADCNIPFIDKLLGDSVELIQLSPADITSESVKEADALLTRTRTHCNAALLDGSRCTLVATATIGTDHIDFDYCNARGIKVVSAPGCNAPAVAQYVWASIVRLTAGIDPSMVSVGVVGVGHVGSIVERWGRSMGYHMMVCDPPRAEREKDPCFVNLETIARECNVITFHTPHTVTGNHQTHHLANSEFFNALTTNTTIINSARGPIIDTQALLEAIENGTVTKAVIDCWEGEPDINPELLEKATIATPHIAGYSLEGKMRASIAVARAVTEQFNIEYHDRITEPGAAPATVTREEVIESYDPFADTAILKSTPATFEQQRNRYALRHEL